MTSHDHIKLTSSELSSLFGAYVSDTLSICVLSYFLNHVEDSDIKDCVKFALESAQTRMKKEESIFRAEGIVIPVAFSEQDVNVRAPRLYSDEFILHYVSNIGVMGLNAYATALPTTARQDIREFFSLCLQAATELFNQSVDILLNKGLYIRPPYIPYPQVTEFVHKQHFLAGWVGEQRPLTSTEISFLFMNLYRNTLGSALLTGFSQTAHSKEIRKYMERGAEIGQHHSAVFAKFLEESNLPVPTASHFTVTDSVEAVFSDKLMMSHTAALYNAGSGFYGRSIGGSSRKDLSAAYSRLMIEVGEYSLDGAKIMIENGWVEKPPSAPNRKDLAGG
ncbi:DUF3231 family protein [Pseudobacillus sp. FSL P4-0506]|uniref:DUF3231 family protein n=1 Tax=Pseudobacillus sp. FSL P4-0506 TaxID=2921576 RepID=UPI0030FB8B60